MVRFEELQQLWQNQPQPAAPAIQVDARGMYDTLRRFGRRQNFLNSLKALLIVWQTWYCLSKLGVSVLTVVGQALFVIGCANMLLTDWRNQLGIAHLDFTRPSAGFVDTAIERLRDPNAPFHQRFWLHVVLIVTGLNMAFATKWAVEPPQARLLNHIGLSIAPLAAYIVGLKIRSKRYEVEYRPIRERLITMKQALKEQSR